MEVEEIINKIKEAGCELVQTSDNWLELKGADKLDPDVDYKSKLFVKFSFDKNLTLLSEKIIKANNLLKINASK